MKRLIYCQVFWKIYVAFYRTRRNDIIVKQFCIASTACLYLVNISQLKFVMVCDIEFPILKRCLFSLRIP